jgi:hypothetical protein
MRRRLIPGGIYCPLLIYLKNYYIIYITEWVGIFILIKFAVPFIVSILVFFVLQSCALPGSKTSGPGTNVSLRLPNSPGNGLSAGDISLSFAKDNVAKTEVFKDRGGGMRMEEIKSGDSSSWKVTGTGDWMGMTLKVKDPAGYSDMTDYKMGSLRFRYKAGKGAFLVGVKSRGQDDGKVVWAWIDVTNSSGPNQWYKVVIPVREFMKAPSTLDLRHIEHLFMFASFKENGYKPGDTFLIRDVAWTRQTNWND